MHMALPVAIQALRVTHILAGFTAFVIAPIPLLTAKGGKIHRRWGKIYFWAMAVVASTALVLALWLPVLFLAFVAVFSFYFAFRGYRVLFRKRPLQGQGPVAIDWAAAVLALLGSGGLIVLGILRPSPVWMRLSVVAIIFGVVGVAFAASDLWQFTHPPADKNFWWYGHLGGMIASYIAAVTAFSVVNFRLLPTTLRWLWPIAIGVPGISIWTRYYKRKFARSSQVVEAES
jgi:uncharacterized membrane protein